MGKPALVAKLIYVPANLTDWLCLIPFEVWSATQRMRKVDVLVQSLIFAETEGSYKSGVDCKGEGRTRLLSKKSSRFLDVYDIPYFA